MAAPTQKLVLIDSKNLPGRILSELLSARMISSIDSVDVITNSRVSLSEGSDLPHALYSEVFSISEAPGCHTAAFLASVASLLVPGGDLLLHEPIAARSVAPEESAKLGAQKVATLSTKETIERSLLFAGFASWQANGNLPGAGLSPDWTGITPAAIGSTKGPLVVPFVVKAKKPEWSTGSSFKLKKRSSAPPAAAETEKAMPQNGGRIPSAPAAATWRIGSGGGSALEDEELLDEDSLLTPEDIAPPPKPALDAAGCGVAKSAKKACKNCTCGRLEMEKEDAANGGTAASTKLTMDQISNAQSACGSCGLGDAFRCAGCPYRGLPPFKLGEKVALPDSLLAADV